MIYGREKLLSWFDMQGNPYYSIYRTGKEQSGNYADTNTTVDDATMETARARLNQWLSLQQSGNFFIVTNHEQKATSKGRAETHFTLSASDSAQPIATAPAIPISGLPGIGYVTKDEANQMAMEKFEMLWAKKKNEELTEKVNELEKENRELGRAKAAPLQQFISAISPHIGAIVSGLGFGPKMPAVTGTGEGITDLTADPTAIPVGAEINHENLQQVVSLFVQTLCGLYPDTYQDILIKLTDKLRKDPGQIDLLIKML